MKKIFCLIAFLSMALAATSCIKDEETDRGFTIEYFCYMDTDTSDYSERYDQMVAAVEQVPYFKTKTYTYFGKRIDANTKAAQEFVDNVNKIDTKEIEGRLNEEEEFGIMMSEASTGEVVVMVRWSLDQAE